MACRVHVSEPVLQRSGSGYAHACACAARRVGVRARGRRMRVWWWRQAAWWQRGVAKARACGVKCAQAGAAASVRVRVYGNAVCVAKGERW